MLFANDGLFPVGEELAMQENLASWVVLSVWLNDTRNLYPIRGSFNQAKKKIPLSHYFPGPNQDAHLKTYIDAPVKSKDKGEMTVNRNLQDWARSMAMYGNSAGEDPDHNLVAFIGFKICECMGWTWIKTTTWSPPTARGLRH